MLTEEVPVIQKRIIRLCNQAGKPVITATQMLDSMIRNPRPCLLYTSDAADERSSVDLGGRRIIKKKR